MIDSIELNSNGARITFSDVVTSKEIIDANIFLINDPYFKTFKYELWIFHLKKDPILNIEDFRELAEQDRKASTKNQKLKIAIVSNSPLFFGLSRMYEAFYGLGPWEIMIFYDLEKAEEWIGSDQLQ